MERTAAFKFDRVFPGIGWLWCVAGLPAEGAIVRPFLIEKFVPSIICQLRDPKTVVEDEKSLSTGIKRISDCPLKRAGTKVKFHDRMIHFRFSPFEKIGESYFGVYKANVGRLLSELYILFNRKNRSMHERLSFVHEWSRLVEKHPVFYGFYYYRRRNRYGFKLYHPAGVFEFGNANAICLKSQFDE